MAKSFMKGDRSRGWNVLATLYPASDGKCFVVTMHGHRVDARPDLKSAASLVIFRLGDL